MDENATVKPVKRLKKRPTPLKAMARQTMLSKTTALGEKNTNDSGRRGINPVPMSMTKASSAKLAQTSAAAI